MRVFMEELGIKTLGAPSAGFWPPVEVKLITGLQVSCAWDVENPSELDGEVYMELGIIRPMFWGNLTLAATLPNHRAHTELDHPELVTSVESPIVLVPAGSELVTVAASLELAPGATPLDVVLNVDVRIRHVTDANAVVPSSVGEPIEGGVHTQEGVITVVVARLKMEALSEHEGVGQPVLAVESK